MALPASDEAIHNDHKTYENTDIDALTQLSQPTETLNIDQPTASHKSFPLLDLPLELQRMIYRAAITSGSTNILRTSRFIHNEASPLVHKAGIFRIRAQNRGYHYHYIRTPPADLQLLRSIQNIEIRVTIEFDPFYPEDFDWRKPEMAAFTDGAAAVQRDTCYVVFRTCIRLPFKRPEVFLDVIRKLRGFNTIIVTVIAGGWVGDAEPQRAIIRAENKPVYDIALKELVPVFGPGVWYDAAVQENRYLEFRPKQG